MSYSWIQRGILLTGRDQAERRRPELKEVPSDYKDGEHHYQESKAHRNRNDNYPHEVKNEISGQECTPKHDIIFTKVHKSGSSTVQNIFLRYGDRHDLKFVLPPQGHHLGYPNYFDKDRHMLHTKEDKYNIFCHHSRFSPDVTAVMPEDALYISIVRDPVDVFESAFTYFKIDYRMGALDDPNALTNFLSNPRQYITRMKSKVHTRNNMLYDFGVPAETYEDEVKMKSAIEEIRERFSLILIGEHFEESLILLRDLLCWTLEDVVVFRLNSRNENSVTRVSEQDQERIRDWNKGDVMLYRQSNRTLWQKVESYGRERMAAEVERLKKLTNQYYKDCVESDHALKGDADFAVWQPRGVQINGFILKESARGNPVCERMIKPEIQYTEELRRKQFGKNALPHGQRSRRGMRKRYNPNVMNQKYRG